MSDFSDEAEVLAEAKIALRRRVLARRRAMPGSVRAAAAGLVRTELTDLVRRLRPRRVAGYVPVGSEPGGPELPEALRAALAGRGELLLPVLRPDLDLDWAPYTGPDRLHAAGRGMREPAADRLGVGAVADAELVVVPALAVDRSGVRLGRGGGSYDRALARLAPGALTVALLYDEELVDVVPAVPHDRRVESAITPAGGYHRIGGSAMPGRAG